MVSIRSVSGTTMLRTVGPVGPPMCCCAHGMMSERPSGSGRGAAAPQWVDGPQYEHYIHMSDPVPTLFGLGRNPAGDAALAGKGAKVIRFAGDVNGTAPFETADPQKKWLWSNADTHAVDKSYLKMEKQRNGGCEIEQYAGGGGGGGGGGGW